MQKTRLFSALLLIAALASGCIKYPETYAPSRERKPLSGPITNPR